MDDASVEPMVMPLDLLREITNGFSEVGSGSFGKVYKGVYQDGGKIAVKMLYDMPGLDDEQFQNEFKNLTRLRHQNIVRLVGYCYDVQEVPVQYEGKLVLAEKTHRALCLEYMSNGSLDKFLSDECDRYNWHTCFRIIKGICQGLKYLHNELKPPIYHLDLKPANVLLDENMVPRIADFGISRLFSDEQTKSTRSLLGTLGYSPPEFIRSRLVSNKFDIFSLGVVIIKMMAGCVGYYNSAEMSSQEFTNLVQKNWTKRLHEASNLRKAYSEQVKICIEIGLGCVQEDRHKRPTIQDIVDRLNETVAKSTYAARKDLLLICQIQGSLGNITQPGSMPNHQRATPSRNDPSSSYNPEANVSTFRPHAQYPNDRKAEQIYHGSTSNQSARFKNSSNPAQSPGGIVVRRTTGRQINPQRGTNSASHRTQTLVGLTLPRSHQPSAARFHRNVVATARLNHSEARAGPREERLDDESRGDNKEYSAEVSLPGIEGFQIVGDPRPGSTLRACGFPINGTTLCNFQWVRWLDDGTRQYIDGATVYNFVVTADEVGALLAVECTPMDDNCRQGDLVRKYANSENKITCDPDMQNDINICVSRGRSDFDVFFLPKDPNGHSPDEWEHGALVLRRTGYQLNFSRNNEVVIDEKYSPNLQIKIPTGRTTQFVLVSSGGVNLPFNTQGITEPNNEDNDVRLRDLIVLVLRTFQKKALDATTVKTELKPTPISHTEQSLPTSSGEKLSIATPSLRMTNPIAEVPTSSGEKLSIAIPSPSMTNPIAEVTTLSSNKSWISSLFKRKGKD